MRDKFGPDDWRIGAARVRGGAVSIRRIAWGFVPMWRTLSDTAADVSNTAGGIEMVGAIKRSE
ncbi:hypothetical protein AUC45_04340 [Erythrobacter sp. YT30]|nr:hypothetical protein AUC45_04340 [Erythrobacter sp. YT30]